MRFLVPAARPKYPESMSASFRDVQDIVQRALAALDKVNQHAFQVLETQAIIRRSQTREEDLLHRDDGQTCHVRHDVAHRLAESLLQRLPTRRA